MVAKKRVPQTKTEGITIPRLVLGQFTVTLVGESPLICHAWSTKAKRSMLDKQMKKAKGAKEAKDPEEDFAASLYLLPEGVAYGKHQGYGFPAVAFKAAAVDACSHVEGITKVEARGAFHITSEYVEIMGEPTPREDMVRVGMGTADIRFRAEFKQWHATVPILHNPAVLSAEQIIHLFDLAGFAIGVGDWRPQKDGPFGRFHVAREGER